MPFVLVVFFLLIACCALLIRFGLHLITRPRSGWNWRMSFTGGRYRGRRPEPSRAALLAYRIGGVATVAIGIGIGVLIWWLLDTDRIEL